MTSRRPGLILIGCLASLDVLSHQAIGLAGVSTSGNLAVRPTASHFWLANNSADLAPAAGGLALGSQGAPVTELQKTLRLLGYFEGPITGVYGESTAAAVSKFQKAVDLQRSTGSTVVAQVPANSSKPPQSPAKGWPMWLYSLGGIAAVAAGVTLLRLSGRSRSGSLPPAHGTTTTAPPSLTPAVGAQSAAKPNAQSTASLAHHQSPVTKRTDDHTVIQGPAAVPSQPQLKPPEPTPTAELPPPQPTPIENRKAATDQLATNGAGPTNGHPLAAPPAHFAPTSENGRQPAAVHEATPPPSANGHQSAPATPTPAPLENRSPTLTIESTPLSETTRMAKINIVEELMQDLRSPDAVKRHKVIWELSHRGDTRAVQPLVDLLVDSDSKQRSLILSALSEIGTRTLRPMSRALAISLQDDSPDVRKNAIRDLTRVYDMVAQISQLLHKATDDPDADVQETARWALGQLNRIRSVPSSDNFPALKNSVSPPENFP